LTETLREFRSYRPKNHNDWLSWVENEATKLKVCEYSLRSNVSGVLYLSLVDQVIIFRERHWRMTKEVVQTLTLVYHQAFKGKYR
jgi:indoleamine 2,3-dioxygenase